jgi:hypothetical protein
MQLQLGAIIRISSVFSSPSSTFSERLAATGTIQFIQPHQEVQIQFMRLGVLDALLNQVLHPPIPAPPAVTTTTTDSTSESAPNGHTSVHPDILGPTAAEVRSMRIESLKTLAHLCVWNPVTSAQIGRRSDFVDATKIELSTEHLLAPDTAIQVESLKLVSHQTLIF